jgi:hypothetical protein
MKKATLRILHEQINSLKSINKSQNIEIDNLNKRIDNLKNKKEPILNERNAGRKAYADKKVITKIYTFYVDGKSLQGVTDGLNRLGIKTTRGNQWSKSTIRFILLNSKNVVNQLIGKDLFNRAVKLLNDNKKQKLL